MAYFVANRDPEELQRLLYADPERHWIGWRNIQNAESPPERALSPTA